MSKSFPFLFGAQYYRAPTPEPECWEHDHRHMRELGFNAVKYWVQWRWSHRRNDRFVFDDLDGLMEQARANGLAVTLNVIMDVAPHWLFEKYPDALQVGNYTGAIEPYTVGHRQIGGHPGPCYNHPGALEERRKFMAAALEHFRGHPALAMWDVWNEPELSFPQRTPDIRTLACYCPTCADGFRVRLKEKYGALERLNQVWGRCYEEWHEVEVPRNTDTFTDFIDWREFHIETMTREAAWRLEMAREMDPARVRYLHVVPNTMTTFNSITTCADDFEMAQPCEVFAATAHGGNTGTVQIVSAARGKVCYNVESHINHGCTSLHQRTLGMRDLLRDFLPQIGLGIRGFLFWQYRAEVLGFESPAWGLVKPDGSDRPITEAAKTFWETLAPHTQAILACPVQPAPVGIWKSRKNEIFHYAMHRKTQTLVESTQAYLDAFYWDSITARYIDGAMLERGDLDGLKLLVLPSCYYVTEAEAQALREWVASGGVLLNEAHLAAYNGTAGRHSRTVPGCGLAEAWGIRELDSTSSYHLKLEQAEAFQGAITEDVKKALATSGTSGGEFFPIRLADGTLAWGAQRYALLAGEGITPEGAFDASGPCLVSKRIGKGRVFYCGTHLGLGAKKDPAGLRSLVRKAVDAAGIAPVLSARSATPGSVHFDVLADETGPRYILALNRTDEEQQVSLALPGRLRGLFSGAVWESGEIILPGGFVDLLEVE